jgi:hypothetical protein
MYLNGLLATLGVVTGLILCFVLMMVIIASIGKFAIRKKMTPELIKLYLESCAENEDFEEAAKIRDMLQEHEDGNLPKSFFEEYEYKKTNDIKLTDDGIKFITREWIQKKKIKKQKKATS